MPIPRLSTKITLLSALLLVTSMTGCFVPWARGIRSLEDTVTDWRDFVWGKRAYFRRYGHDRSGPFRDGFLEGYHDILQGGDGCVPVVPPKRYWGWRYQSAGGQATVGEWFNGFAAGVAAAKEDGLVGIGCIPISSMYNGTSTVPIESMPAQGQEWGPVETLDPKQVPAPSVEPASPPKTVPGAKSTTMYGPSIYGPANTRVQPVSGSIPVTSSPIPLGSGTVQVTPMTIPKSSIPMRSVPLKSMPLKSIPLSAIPLDSMPSKSMPSTMPGLKTKKPLPYGATSRYPGEDPLSLSPAPVTLSPANAIGRPIKSPAEFSTATKDIPLPLKR